MNRSKIDNDRSAVITEIDAEEIAINYLATLPAEVAKGTAVKAALLLFGLWEAENAKGHSPWRDPSSDPNADDRGLVAADLAKYSKHLLWQPYPDECVREILRGLSPRSALFTALVIMEQVCCSEVVP